MQVLMYLESQLDTLARKVFHHRLANVFMQEHNRHLTAYSE